MGTRKLTVRCPECDSDLTIDAETGEILFHKKAKQPIAGGHSFDDLFEGMKAQRSRADEIFEREKAAMKDRERLLDEKFKEAVKRAEEDPDTGRPVRPFDLD
jgi:hypothetical protein